MIILEVGDENIQKDDFSGARFGEESQIEVLGWIGRIKDKGSKIYVVNCKICANDPELFGDGLFYAQKSQLESGGQPCGCSPTTHWNEDQYRVLARRGCEQKGLIFLGWVDGYKKGETFCRVACPTHGEIRPKKITSVLSGYIGCASCAKSIVRSDSDWIRMFKDQGCYPTGSLFLRSDRTPTKSREYWLVTCSGCGQVCEVSNQAILSGSMGCGCCRQRQDKAYITIVFDGDMPICAKLGISTNVHRRFLQLNRKSIYELKLYNIWTFSDIKSCKKAETLAKNTVKNYPMVLDEMLDGYSETFYIRDIDKVIKIFEDFGGIPHNPNPGVFLSENEYHFED